MVNRGLTESKKVVFGPGKYRTLVPKITAGIRGIMRAGEICGIQWGSRICLCNSIRPSKTWTYGAQAAPTFRSSLHSQVRPAPAFTDVAASLHHGDRSIRAQARSRSSVHRSIPSPTPKGPATRCSTYWRTGRTLHRRMHVGLV